MRKIEGSCVIRLRFLSAVCVARSAAARRPAGAPLDKYLMGEKVHLGHLSYTVFETQWLTHLGDGRDGPRAAEPVLPDSLQRGQQRQRRCRRSRIRRIQDDQGPRLTRKLSNGEGVPQWAGYLRNVKPADNVQGNIVFDAPPAHYKLKLSDETGDQVRADRHSPFVRRRDSRSRRRQAQKK